MDMIKGIPAWNFQLLVNVFEDDNYWDVSLQEDNPEAYEAITSIGKKYSDIAEYEEALALYNKYEPQIIEYYGGEKVVDYIMENYDTIPVGIIKPPKLKSKVKEKYIKGINYSTGKYYPPVSSEEQVDWDKDRFTDGNHDADQLPRMSRHLKRALRTIINKTDTSASSVYFNTDIIAQIRNGNYESEECLDDKISRMSVDEHVKMYDKRHKTEYRELTNEEKLALINDDKNTANSYVPRYSLVQPQQVSTSIFIKKMMIKSGLNPISDGERSNMTTAEIKRLATFLGAEYVYDDKMMKKMIKKSEKLKKKAEKERDRYDKDYRQHNASVERALTNLLTSRSRLQHLADWEEDDE